jgi:hypothetical protein
MPEKTSKNGFYNPFQESMRRLQASVNSQQKSLKLYRQSQKQEFDAASGYLHRLYDFLAKLITNQALLPDRESFDYLMRHVFSLEDLPFDHIGQVDREEAWLQHLLLAGTCESEIMDFDRLKGYFQGKVLDLRRLACDISFLFEKWERYIRVELEIIPGQVLTDEIYVPRQSRTGNWRNVKRLTFRTLPDKGRLVLTLVSLPDLISPVKKKR